MTEQIAKIVASVFAWLAARKIDQIVGKYLASIQIAFDRAASQKAHEVYEKTYKEIVDSLATKSNEWAKWRDETRSNSLSGPDSNPK